MWWNRKKEKNETWNRHEIERLKNRGLNKGRQINKPDSRIQEQSETMVDGDGAYGSSGKDEERWWLMKIEIRF
jgi:hypothetical protein